MVSQKDIERIRRGSANRKHLAMLKRGVEHWNRWREENPNEKPELSGASFWEWKLDGVNLSHSSLSSTSFALASLRKADFSGADLQRASLRGADMRNANLAHAHLKEASMDPELKRTTMMVPPPGATLISLALT